MPRRATTRSSAPGRLARVIQEYIKKPLADELLFGKLEHGGTVKVVVTGKGEERALSFEYLPADPTKRAKAKSERDDEDEDEPQAVLVDAAPRKALPEPQGAQGASAEDRRARCPTCRAARPTDRDLAARTQGVGREAWRLSCQPPIRTGVLPTQAVSATCLARKSATSAREMKPPRQVSGAVNT